jgi:radical SAM superfamily enzyme YgiQ (UPF0313 family)
MRVVLVSTYELGRQPFGLASPAAWLRDRGFDVTPVDTTRAPLDEAIVREAGLVAFHLPMHTATRLAGPLLARVRSWNPSAHLCAYGVYAPLNESWLRSAGVSTVLGGEFEQELAELAEDLRGSRVEVRNSAPLRLVPRLQFRVPDRVGLPSLDRYATLQVGPGERRVTGYTEASRGCKHLCRHCPIVPVYNGQFRVVPVEIVMADVGRQVAAGARHLTFGDPDFFNGIGHARAVVTALARQFPGLSYDVTIKIEHLLRYATDLPLLARTGCAFVTSAVESLDDRVLGLLEKNHTRRDFESVVELCRSANLPLSPTFVPFTPWTGLDDYVELLETLERLGLIEHVAPIQLAIRLLVPEGSRLLQTPEIRPSLGAFDAGSLTYPWRHADPRVDDLQDRVARLVGVRTARPRAQVFRAVADLAHEAAGRPRPPASPEARVRATIPYLDEPWYC